MQQTSRCVTQRQHKSFLCDERAQLKRPKTVNLSFYPRWQSFTFSCSPLSSAFYILFPSPFRESSPHNIYACTHGEILKGEGNRFQYTKWTVTNCQTSHKFVNISFLFISRCLYLCLNFGIVFYFLGSQNVLSIRKQGKGVFNFKTLTNNFSIVSDDKKKFTLACVGMN